MKNIDEIRGDNASSEAPEEKNPYQQVLDLPEDLPIPIEEGMEMVKEALLWLSRHPEETEKIRKSKANQAKAKTSAQIQEK